jgi:hypothetical protein
MEGQGLHLLFQELLSLMLEEEVVVVLRKALLLEVAELAGVVMVVQDHQLLLDLMG